MNIDAESILKKVDEIFNKYLNIAGGNLKKFSISEAIDEMQTETDNCIQNDSANTKEVVRIEFKKCRLNQKYKTEYQENRIKQTSSTARVFFPLVVTVTITAVFGITTLENNKYLVGFFAVVGSAMIAKSDNDNYDKLWKDKIKLSLIENVEIKEKIEVIQLLDGINKTPKVLGGAARIRNTRIPVWSLVQSRQMGASDLEILEAHPELTQADLNNAWFYTETFPDEIEQAISANDTN